MAKTNRTAVAARSADCTTRERHGWYIPYNPIGAGQQAQPDLKCSKEKTMAEKDNGTAIGLGWFLAGLGLGALVGVLYAPKAGKETREDLRNSALDAKDKAGDLYDQGRQKANEYAEQGRQYYEQGRNKAGEP